MVPGEVMMTAESRCRASTPCEIYMAMMPPETCAMPLVMMVISSLRVALERNGRMVSGASVWPMKMLAATFMLSAPEMRMVLSMTHAMPRITICISPMWYSTAKKAEMKMMVGSTWKAKMAPLLAPSRLPNAPELGRPSWPNKSCVPAKVPASILVTTSPAHVITCCPKPNRSTREGKENCRPSPQAMVRQRMCLRSVEKRYAASNTARIPSNPVNRSIAVAP